MAKIAKITNFIILLCIEFNTASYPQFEPSLLGI